MTIISRLPSIDLAAAWSLVWPAVAIALLRIGDVSLNVFRVVFVVQERTLLASLAAGAEALMWLTAAGIVFADMTAVRAAGFVVGVAAGTAIGVRITRALRLGMVTVRIYASAEPTSVGGRDIARAIHAAGYRATVFRGHGYAGEVDMVLATVRRREAERVIDIARKVEPAAFAAIDNAPHPAATSSVSTGRV